MSELTSLEQVKALPPYQYVTVEYSVGQFKRCVTLQAQEVENYFYNLPHVLHDVQPIERLPIVLPDGTTVQYYDLFYNDYPCYEGWEYAARMADGFDNNDDYFKCVCFDHEDTVLKHFRLTPVTRRMFEVMVESEGLDDETIVWYRERNPHFDRFMQERENHVDG